MKKFDINRSLQTALHLLLDHLSMVEKPRSVGKASGPVKDLRAWTLMVALEPFASNLKGLGLDNALESHSADNTTYDV